MSSVKYTSFAFTRRLIDAGVDASVGSVGDGYDNTQFRKIIGYLDLGKLAVAVGARRQADRRHPDPDPSHADRDRGVGGRRFTRLR